MIIVIDNSNEEDNINMATGPALRQLASHRAIHDGAYGEAKELTDVLAQLYEEEREEDCLNAAKALADYMEERLISHADAEEEGLYLDIMNEHPELEKEIHMLTRDHDIERIILKNIKKQLEDVTSVSKDLIHEFYALLVVNEIHSRSEESMLLED